MCEQKLARYFFVTQDTWRLPCPEQGVGATFWRKVAVAQQDHETAKGNAAGVVPVLDVGAGSKKERIVAKLRIRQARGDK